MQNFLHNPQNSMTIDPNSEKRIIIPPMTADTAFLSETEEFDDVKTVKNYSKGDQIFREGEETDRLVCIYEGSGKMVSYDADGKEVIYGFFRDGDAFWGSFFEREHRYRFSVICLSDTVVYEYPRSAVEKMMIRNQNIFSEIIESLSSQLKDADEKIAVLSAPTPEERLAGFFLYSFRRSKDGTVVRRLDDISGAINLRQEGLRILQCI